MSPALASLARRQGGCFSTAQALAAGVTRRNLRTLVARGRLVSPHPHVYLASSTPDSLPARLWAAQLSIGPPMWFAGLAAAYVHRLDPLPALDRLDVVVPRSRRAHGVAVRRVADSELAGVRVVGGHPVTSVPITLREVARVVDERRLVSVVQDALRRRLTTPWQLAAGTGRGRLGSAALRGAVEEAAGSHSRAERRLAAGIRDRGLPRPRRQYPLRGTDGSSYWLDFCWPEARLGVEVDGPVHLDAARFDRDLRRRNALLLDHGVRVLHFAEPRIYADIGRVLDEIERGLRRTW